MALQLTSFLKDAKKICLRIKNLKYIVICRINVFKSHYNYRLNFFKDITKLIQFSYYYYYYYYFNNLSK